MYKEKNVVSYVPVKKQTNRKRVEASAVKTEGGFPGLQGKVTVNVSNCKLIARYPGKSTGMAKIWIDGNICLHPSAENNNQDCIKDSQQ